MLHLAQISSDHTPQYEENVLEDSSSQGLYNPWQQLAPTEERR